MSVNKYFSHVPVLGHIDKGTIDGRIAMRMIFSHGITDNTRTLTVWLVRSIVHLVHGIENSSLYRFQTISDIRQGSGHDDRHRVFQKVTADLVR